MTNTIEDLHRKILYMNGLILEIYKKVRSLNDLYFEMEEDMHTLKLEETKSRRANKVEKEGK